MRYYRTMLFGAALVGLGGAWQAWAQSPAPGAATAKVSPYQPGTMAPTTVKPWGSMPVYVGQPAPPTPARTSFLPPDGAPASAIPRDLSPSVVRTAELPTPVLPTLPDAVPVVPVVQASYQIPSVSPGPRVTTEAIPDANPLMPPLPKEGMTDSGPKPFSPPPSVSVIPTPGMSTMAPAKVLPSVTLEALVPESVSVGTDYSYELVVKNDGAASVGNVRVDEVLPTGAKLVTTEPAAEVTGTRMAWALGTMEPGTTRKVKVTLRAETEGDLKSRATLSFASTTETKVKVTKPKLGVQLAAMETVRAGEQTTLQIKLTNTGSGPASNLILRATLTEGLSHPGGNVLEMKLPNLAAGETKTLPLKLTAAKSGAQSCAVSISADGTNSESAKHAVNVVEAKLTARQMGPAKCLVKAEPVYMIEMTNPGTATTDPIAVTATVPMGFDFMGASDGGTYNAATRELSWKVAGLEPGRGKAISAKLRCIAPSDGKLVSVSRTVPVATEPASGTEIVQANAMARGLEAKAETAIRAEGMPALRFEVVDIEDPVEVGKEAMYEIKLVNQGTAPCTNVQIIATVAEGTAAVAANGSTGAKANGAQVVFEPITKLDVKGEATYRVRVKGTTAGDHKFKVQVSCDQIRVPVAKEENTRFYKE